MKRLLIVSALIISYGAYSQSSSKSKETSRTTTSDGVSSESSITRSDDSYKFEARFVEEKYQEIQTLLLDRLGTTYLSQKGDVFEWEKGVNSRPYFRCRLTNSELRLNLNREQASDDFYEMIDELGDDLRDIIQKHGCCTPSIPLPPQPPSNPNSTDPQLLDQELREAERELARAKERLERLKKKKGN